jgi:hypothetical protein
MTNFILFKQTKLFLSDPESGICICERGWIGRYCDEKCPTGYFGQNCEEKCSDNMSPISTCVRNLFF